MYYSGARLSTQKEEGKLEVSHIVMHFLYHSIQSFKQNLFLSNKVKTRIVFEL